MADMRVRAGSVQPARATADGDKSMVLARALRDGSMSMAQWAHVAAMEGRVFVANAGTVTTPITFGAGSIDTTEPDIDISVPTSTLVIPLNIQVVFETFGTTLLLEGMASTGTGAIATATNGTAVTPRNLRTDGLRGSTCTVWSNIDASGSTYQTGNVYEFWRFGKNKTVDIATADDDSTDVVTRYEWSAADSGVYPILYSTSATPRLNVFAGSQAGTGFITVVYAELPYTDIA